MRKVGLAAFENRERSAQQYSNLSTSLIQQQSKELSTQLEVFRSTLEYFAVEHAQEIRTNPSFRSQFAQMCTNIGVDPLASSRQSKKGGSFWASTLGKDVNDFYYELAVKVIQLSRFTRDTNGGLIAVSEIQRRLANSSPPLEVTHDDIKRAVESLKILGNGFGLVEVAGTQYIRSVPSELSSDQSAVLAACEALGFVSVSILGDNLNWDPARSSTVLDEMVRAGVIWVDEQSFETEYWAPSWIEKAGT